MDSNARVCSHFPLPGVALVNADCRQATLSSFSGSLCHAVCPRSSPQPSDAIRCRKSRGVVDEGCYKFWRPSKDVKRRRFIRDHCIPTNATQTTQTTLHRNVKKTWTNMGIGDQSHSFSKYGIGHFANPNIIIIESSKPFPA